LLTQVIAGALSLGELVDTLCQRRDIAPAQHEAALKPFGWVGLAYQLRPRQTLALAAFKPVSGRGVVVPVL
jgi:hypothetical protein